MTIYFQGSELEALWPNPSVGPGNEQNVVESPWSRAGSLPPGGASGWLRADAGQELPTFYGHVYFASVNPININANNIGMMEWTDASGVGAVRLYNNDNGVWQAQYWDGDSWVNFGGQAAIIQTGVTYDVRIQLGNGTTTPDIIEIYINETVASAVSGVNLLKSNFPNGIRYQLHRTVNNSTFSWSQCVIADVPTLDWNSKTVVPATDGTYSTDGTGVVTDVNESPVNNATFISMDTAGQRRSFKAAARTLTNEVKGVTITGRIRLGDSGAPTKMKPFLLIGGTRYYGTTFTLTLGYLNYQYTWNSNPSTGVAWTPSQVNDANLEWGWEAVA